MMKNENRKKACLLWGSVVLICALAAVGILLYLLDCCRITDASRSEIREVYLSVMDDDKTSYRQTEGFTDLFVTDSWTIAKNLAVIPQFEDKGQYVGERPVDIVSYYYRRHPEMIPEQYQDLHIEYKLKDLLAWDNVQWYELDEANFVEKYPRYKNTGSYGKKTETPPVSEEDYEVGFEGEEFYGDTAYGVIVEDFLPCDGISLYEREYPEKGIDVFNERNEDGRSDPSIRQILVTTIEELNNNEELYEKNAAFMTADSNLKYVLLDPNGLIIKSNLRLKKYVMQMEMNQRTKLLRDAFTSQQTYLIYTYGDQTVETGKLGGYLKKEITDEISPYDYAYPEKSTLLCCVLDEGKNQEVLGGYKTTDLYGKADAKFSQVKAMGYVVMMTICGLVALLGFIFFTAFVPSYEKEEVRGFHKVPTILAAAILFFLGMLCVTPPAMLLDSYGERMLPGGEYGVIFVPVVMVCTTLGMMAFLYGWYSLILRLKARTILSDSLIAVMFFGKNSWCKRFFKWIFGALKKVADFFAGQQSVLLRVILPYVAFLMINAMIVVASDLSGGGIFLCFLFDVAVGAFLYIAGASREKINVGIEKIIEGDLDYQIDTQMMLKGDQKTALFVNQMGDTISTAVERSMADERMKTELITNVSHDIKTPLTSVINYVDLLKREDIKSERAREYIRILDEKSQRLKVLIFDLVEASKISSGNITLQNSKLDMCELISQSLGEFEDRFQDRNLSVVYQKPEQSMYVWADPARMWRVFENLLGNVSKYAMPGSRVYIQAEQTPEDKVALTIKNMSETPLNVSEQELMERFVRGDEARSSEGSGLGLSIARDLVKLMKGELSVHLDGDLFKVSVEMPKMEQEPEPVSVVTPEEAAPEDTKETPSEEAKPEDEAEKQKTQDKPDPDAQTE